MINNILRKLQLKHKLIMINLLITGIVFLFAATIILLSEILSAGASLHNDLSTQARIMADSCNASLVFNDYKSAMETLAVLKSAKNIECAIIYSRKGAVFATYWRPDIKEKVTPRPPLKDGYNVSFKALSLFQGIELDNHRLGTIFIRSDLKKLQSILVRHLLIILTIMPFVIVIAFKLITRWQRIIIEPIMHLFQVMKLVSWEKNYSLKANVYNEDEIGALAQGFNAMLEQIQERDMKLRKEIAERSRAEDQIRALNEGLELKVEEKTKQLMEAREELVRKEKLAVLGQLSGFVGHELRNPLGVMNNAVYYLMNVVPTTDETTREYLDIIKGEIGNSQRIITDLLEFSRTKTPQARVVTVRELIDASLARCEVSESVELSVQLPDTLPRIRVDPLQMGQVFQNLITNAVQAMPNGGTVRISARPVQGSTVNVQCSEAQNIEPGTLNVERDTDFIEISVEDTGEGISVENMKKLFQPLFTTKARGIGLGLLVCKNLTDANGGAIYAESEEGKGSRFVILVPMEG